MFSIYNGTELKQWSTGNLLTNPHMKDGDNVRFVSGSGMVETNIAYTKEGTVVVEVPNRILTLANSICVELITDHKCSANFDVVKQPKPNGYVLVDNKKTMPAVQPVTHWVERKEVTVECAAQSPNVLEGFPLFAVGDTVTVKVDGVEYSLVAFDGGVPMVGDTMEQLQTGTGEYGWILGSDEPTGAHFLCVNSHAVSYVADIVHKIDEKFIPNYGALVMNLNALIGEIHFEGQLSDETVVYAVSPDISFHALPELSMCNFGTIGFAKKGGWRPTFVVFSDTRIGSGSTIFVLLVHSDNIEQGIADYKSDYGIE